MRKERTEAPVKSIRQNNGQLSWLPKNPRQWTQNDIDRTVASIQEDPDFLEDRPLLLVPGPKDGQYIVFAGNLRFTASKKLDLPKVPAVVYYPDTDEERLTVKRRAMKDNGTFGAWDMDALANQWDDLPLVDWGVPAWDPEPLDEKPEGKAEEDGFNPDEQEIPARCSPGDIWKLGQHRLMCGDSTNEAAVLKLYDGGQPFAIVTDPPYCSGGFQESGKRSGSIGTRDNIMIANDTLSTRGYIALIKRVLECAGKCSMAYVFTDWRMFVNLFETMELSGYGVRNMIVWDKGTPGMGIGWRSQHEICVFASRSAQPFNPHLAQGNVIQCPRTGNVNHPTEKPVELIGKILRVTDMATEVYDPFGGSGTTLIAAEQLGRKCYMMELEPHYCDVILARWEKLTGQTAERVSGS